jgi:predicted metal-dependent HD superfamily phosphohydrolase
MGVYDAPQWLLSAWSRTCEGAGATASPDQIRAVGSRLIDRWSEPGRNFHNLKHLVHVLSRVDELAEETHEPDLVRLAAWYHGAIFDAAEKAAYANRGGEDEVASAELARTELRELGLPDRSVERVHHLVIALARHAASPGDFDCAVLCDADLAVLAAEPQRYKAYLKEVRAEYAHVPVQDYLRARATILTKLLSRPALFSSPLGAAWEEPARQNVAAELHRITKELAKIEASAEGDTGTRTEVPDGGTDGSSAGASSGTVDATAASPAAGREPHPDTDAGTDDGAYDGAAADHDADLGPRRAGRPVEGRTPTGSQRTVRRSLPTFGRR